MLRLLPLAFLGISFGVAAANNDDGFVWIDANTKIKVQPIGKSAGSAATGATRTPQPKKVKTEKPRK